MVDPASKITNQSETREQVMGSAVQRPHPPPQSSLLGELHKQQVTTVPAAWWARRGGDEQKKAWEAQRSSN